MLEEKLDLLTKETVALRKAIEENTAAQGATAAGKPAAKKPAADDDGDEDAAPKRGRGRPAKPKAEEPEHDAAEVEAAIRKVSKEVGKPVAVKIIKSFKCDDLADLLTHPEHFDAAFAKAEEALAPEGDDEQGEEEDDI